MGRNKKVLARVYNRPWTREELNIVKFYAGNKSMAQVAEILTYHGFPRTVNAVRVIAIRNDISMALNRRIPKRFTTSEMRIMKEVIAEGKPSHVAVARIPGHSAESVRQTFCLLRIKMHGETEVTAKAQLEKAFLDRVRPLLSKQTHDRIMVVLQDELSRVNVDKVK